MANEKFKVKFGLAVGDTVATVDGTTGNIVTTGDIAVNGGDVTTTSATGTLFNTGATTVNIAGAGTTVSIGANTGTTTVNNSLVADDISVVTVDTTNLEVTNIKAKDGTAAMTIADTTGVVSVNTLQVNGNTTLGSDTADEVSVLANNITFGFNDTATPRGILGQMSTGAVDYWFIGGAEASGTSDAGFAMIATGDNGNDPIYARQYNGSPLSGTVNKQLTLLDASGNTFLAGDLTLGGNGYIYSTTDLALQLTGANVRTPGDLTVDGGDIIGTRPLQISTTDTFTTTGSSISGTTLTIGTLTSGTISVGMAITGGTTVNGTVITANISGSGSGSTWTVNTSQTVASSSITGAGNITLAPITAGSVALSLANGGNLTNNRNYVHGVIRNTTTANTNGDIWELNTSAAQSATNPYFRGLSLDNSADTTRGPANLMRSYSGGAVSGSGSRGRLIFEKARGTAASPTAVQSADVLGSVDVTGYTSTGWLNDTIPAITGTSTFAATENWVSNTNLGTNFNVALAPTATTIASGANLITVLSVSPQSAAHRSDATTFSQGKSGTTTYASLGLTGNTITALNASNVFVRQGTTTTTVPGLILRYSRTDQTGSSDLDGVDFRLSTAGTTTTNNISRIESQYRTSGLHEFGITVSSDNFVADTDTIYFAKADQTKIRTTPAGTTGTVSDTLTLTQLATTLKSDSLVLRTVAAAALPGDKISYGRQYIEAYSTVDQTNPVANAENLMAFENTGISNGISIVTNGTALTRITFANAGIYNLQFSAQLSQTSGGSANTFIWLKKNGANVANTAGDTRVAGNGDRIMAAWNYVFSAAAGDYYELAWSATDTSVILDYSAASAPVPAVPSVILTVVPVGA